MSDADDAVVPSGGSGARVELPERAERPLGPSLPLVATVRRWATGSAGFALGLAAAAAGVLLFTHSSRPFAALGGPLALGAVVGAVVLFFFLRAEESRLARELRTARTGTPVLRGLIARRRVAVPLLSRFASTKLGTAAVLVADGDREGALDALARPAALMRGGRLETLRAIVQADLLRGSGTAADLDRCAKELRGVAPMGNREADLYRTHVLVKAILAQGDGEAGFEVASPLSASADAEMRVYATWLRVWFDLDLDVGEGEGEGEGDDRGDRWPDLSDGDLRMATLVARAHGAESLVSKLTSRLSAIAHSVPRE